MPEKIVTRFAPSPTGLLHGGNYRTAVFAYLFAKQQKGKFIVRIEDTDKARSKKEYEENILETLAWLGLKPDEIFRQSDALSRHTELIRRLIAQGHAYVSQETAPEEGQRSEVIRFRNPKEAVTFTDMIRGPISIDTTDLGDFVIARSETDPVFHFAVVADDADEKVTHVVRGEDHISNTPRQMLIQKALGFDTPIYAHLPLVLGPDKTKLSKRRGAKALTQYRDEGYIPEAVINYLALLGWHPEGEQEIFTIEELEAQFNLARIQKGAGVFDEVKLRWFNHEHLKRLGAEEYSSRVRLFMRIHHQDEPAYLSDIIPLLQERYQTFGDALDALTEGEFSFLDEEDFAAPSADFLLRGAKADAAAVKQNLEKIAALLQECEPFTSEAVKDALFPYATEAGRAAVLWPMRVALSGKEKSPDPFTLAALLRKEKTLARIEKAAQLF